MKNPFIIRWCIVGLGKQGHIAAQAIKKIPHNVVVAAVDSEQERAQAFGSAYHVKKCFTGYADALQEKDIDAFFIASPNYLHAAQSIAALKAGKHVFCEKPMALTVAEARNIRTAARSAAITFAAGFHLRFHPIFQEMKRILATKKIGEIRLVEMHWSIGTFGEEKLPPLPAHMQWRESGRLAGGGAVMARGVHLFDLLYFITGEKIQEVSCYQDGKNKKSLDQLITVIARQKNNLATITTGRQVPESVNHLTIYGSHGRLRAIDPFSAEGTGTLEIKIASRKRDTKFVKRMNLYQKEIEAFSERIRTNKKTFLADETEGMVSVAVTQACLQSIRSKKSVRISLFKIDTHIHR